MFEAAVCSLLGQLTKIIQCGYYKFIAEALVLGKEPNTSSPTSSKDHVTPTDH